MKILILNGSPRCQGLISRMLDIMAEEAQHTWRRSGSNIHP